MPRAPSRSPPVIVRNDSLSVSLFSELADQQTGNMVFSPSSLAEVLHLLEQGAAGETLALLREHPMGSLHVRHAIKPLSANALFVAEDVKLKRDFPQVLRVPFASAPAEAAADINDWCDEHTKGTIPDLISEGSLPSSTRMVAANALYLKERWLHPFPEGQMQPHPFTRADGSKVTASMMRADCHPGRGRGQRLAGRGPALRRAARWGTDLHGGHPAPRLCPRLCGATDAAEVGEHPRRAGCRPT